MIIIIIFLLLVLTLCSIFESSMSALNIIRIKKMSNNNKKAKIVYDLYENFSEVISTILIINCIASVSVSTITAYYFSNLIGDQYLGIVTVVLTIIILVFTEITPKIIGREYSEDYAIKLAYLLKYLVLLLKPINRVISYLEKKIKNEHRVTATKEELALIVKTIEGEGVIEEKESNFLQKVLVLKKLKVQNVMVGKEDVSFLYDSDSSRKVKDCIFRDKHDRIPVIDKENKVVGILYEVDLLDEILEGRPISIKTSMKSPICVSRSTNLASALELLNETRAHMAIVTDRENNFLGIVTLEDIITELIKM